MSMRPSHSALVCHFKLLIFPPFFLTRISKAIPSVINVYCFILCFHMAFKFAFFEDSHQESSVMDETKLQGKDWEYDPATWIGTPNHFSTVNGNMSDSLLPPLLHILGTSILFSTRITVWRCTNKKKNWTECHYLIFSKSDNTGSVSGRMVAE